MLLLRKGNTDSYALLLHHGSLLTTQDKKCMMSLHYVFEIEIDMLVHTMFLISIKIILMSDVAETTSYERF